jgi:hypothetical protein
LDSVEEEDEEQMARQEKQHEHDQERRRRGGDDGSNSFDLGPPTRRAWGGLLITCPRPWKTTTNHVNSRVRLTPSSTSSSSAYDAFEPARTGC